MTLGVDAMDAALSRCIGAIHLRHQGVTRPQHAQLIHWLQIPSAKYFFFVWYYFPFIIIVDGNFISIFWKSICASLRLLPPPSASLRLHPASPGLCRPQPGLSRASAEPLPGLCRGFAGPQPGLCRGFAGPQPGLCRASAGALPGWGAAGGAF